MVATYTFDAGPNACIFLTEKVRSQFGWKVQNVLLQILLSSCKTHPFFISLSVSWQLCWSISLPTTRSQTSFEGRRWRWWRRTWPSCWAAWLCPGWPAAWSTWSTHHLARGQRSCRCGYFLVDLELLSFVHQGDGDALLDKNGMPKNLVRWSERQWNPLEFFWIIQPDTSLLALLSKAQHKLLVWKYIVALLQPTRATFSRNTQCKKSPCWLSRVTHVGSWPSLIGQKYSKD